MFDLFYFMLFFASFSGFYVFCSMRKHLLLTLLGLEFLVLAIYSFFFYFLIFYGLSLYFVLVFLTFSVCEGVLGLGILVGIIRCHGNDSVSSLSVLGW